MVALSVFLLGRGGDDDTPAASTAPASTQVLPLRLPAPQDVTVSAVPDQAQVVVRWSAVGAPDTGITYQVEPQNGELLPQRTELLEVTYDDVPPELEPCFRVVAISCRRPDRRRERPGLPVNALFHPSVSAPSECPRTGDAPGQTLGLGTAPLGSQPQGPLWWGPQDRDVAVATVVAAIEAGAAFVDTAPFYGWGRAEEIVGEAIRDLPTRPPVLTKCGTVPDPNARSREDHSRDAIRADVEASRSRLGLDVIDAVQVHDPDPATPIEATWEALMELVSNGTIAAAGLSNHPVELMERALAVGPIGVVQHQYSLLVRDAESDGVLDWCAARGIPFLAWSPLASGFLVDDFDARSDALHGPAPPPALGVHRARSHPTDAVGPPNRRRAHDTTMVAVALAWVTRRPGVHAIVGARTPAEAELLGRPLPRLTNENLQLLDQAGSA